MAVINNNTSYTNKDFNSIYTELLDIIPNLTNRWNPSNEADPGVVLVKLMSVLGDKLNYNIDKQILECFPGSVTQRKNARQLFDLIGYTMSWYKAAVIEVGFKLRSALVNSDNQRFNTVKIPKFTQITDANTSVSFVTTSDIVLYGEDTSTIKYTNAIQGNLVEYSINNQTDVKLANLDENYKLYLTDINVAQNGIFVCDAGSNIYDWKQVNNVDSYPLGEKVYEFGVSDDETQCYLKFPKDVNDLCVSDSLNIKYLTCDGVNGNILKDVLTNFTTTIEDSEGVAVENQIVIIQSQASQNGADPESIEQAYEHSRLVVGTFDTLVTKKDFKNYIKLLTDNDGRPIVSNVVVADRNDDFNQTATVKALENFETRDRIVISNIAAYDLIAYLLTYEPIHLDDSATLCDRAYNASFIPVSDETTMLVIESMLDEVKAINVNLNLTDDNTNALFAGVYAIDAQIVTSEKLTADEAKELEVNIKKQLEYKYQAYNMQFGSMVNYNDLIDAITEIDSRIKAVSLTKIDYTMKKVVMNRAGTASLQDLTDTDRKDIVARSIARGNVQAYKFDSNFVPDFGQTGGFVTLKTITPTFTPSIGTSSARELKGAEVVNVYAPKIVNTKTYTGGCKVEWTPKSTILDMDDSQLSALGITRSTDGTGGTYYILSPNTFYHVGTGSDAVGNFKVSYTDSNSVVISDNIQDGLIIRSNQAIVSGKNQTISTGNQFEVHEDDTFVLPAQSTKYMLHLDNEAVGTFTLAAGAERLLGVNDFLLYYEDVSASWVQLGSGYTLKNENGSAMNLKNSAVEDMSKMTTEYRYLENRLTIINNDIITLNAGCTLQLSKISGTGTTSVSLSSVPVAIPEGYKLIVTDSTGTQEITKNARNVSYKMFTRLDIIYGSDPVVLHLNDTVSYVDSNNNSGSVVGTDTNASPEILEQTGVNKLVFDQPVSIIGSGTVSPEGIKMRKYNDDNQNTALYARNDAGLVEITTTKEIPISLTGSYLKMLLPIHVVTGTATIQYKTSGGSYTAVYAMSQTASNSYAVGDYILCLPNNTATLKVIPGSGGKVQLGKIKVVSSINTDELSSVVTGGFNVGSTDFPAAGTFTDIITRVNNLAGTNKMDYTYEVQNSDLCIHPTDTESFFDANHVFNKLTIAQMDTTNYNIKVNKFSIRS